MCVDVPMHVYMYANLYAFIYVLMDTLKHVYLRVDMNVRMSAVSTHLYNDIHIRNFMRNNLIFWNDFSL